MKRYILPTIVVIALLVGGGVLMRAFRNQGPFIPNGTNNATTTVIVKPQFVTQPTAVEEPKSTAPLSLVPHTIDLAGGKTQTLSIPEGFKVAAVAQGLGRARFMAWGPGHRLFVTDMKDLSDNNDGKIYILEDFNDKTQLFEKQTTYLSGLRNPNSLAFYTDKESRQWLYVALTDKLVRYAFQIGDLHPTDAAQTITTFPDYGLSYKYGGWHLTRTVAVHDDKVYVSVGSSCNACEEKQDEPQRAAILEMDPDGKNQKVYANGLRNAVGIKWVGNDFFATDMGVDHLGNDVPADKLSLIKEGKHYGWPYCYEKDSRVFQDLSSQSDGWQGTVDCSQVPVSYAAFDAHSAPLGLDYFSSNRADDPALQNYFLVALHGSGVISIGHGNEIVRVAKGRSPEPFVTGFLQNGKRTARPADIISDGMNSFFFTDDLGGVLYHVYK